jgi:GxxExxY protein
MKHEAITSQIIRIFYQVYNELGYGFLEKVYQNAMYIALKQENFAVEPKMQVKVWFRGKEVGEYYPDLIVADTVIIELKAANTLAKEHEAQLLNYLRGTNLEIGLLLNFGLKAEICRKVYDNDLKPNLKIRKSVSNP